MGGVLEFVEDDDGDLFAVSDVGGDTLDVAGTAVGWFEAKLPGKGLEEPRFVEGGMGDIDGLVVVGIECAYEVFDDACLAAPGGAVYEGEAAAFDELPESFEVGSAFVVEPGLVIAVGGERATGEAEECALLLIHDYLSCSSFLGLRRRRVEL